jgi:acyl-CoA thioesterase
MDPIQMEQSRREQILKFFRNDRYAELSGIEIVEVGEGRAKARLTVSERHLNGVDLVHGGAIFTLADLAFAVASNSHGTVAVAINASVSFLKAARSGTLQAEAVEVSRNPRLGSYTVTVTDDAGDIVAIFQGMVYRKSDPLPA